MMSRSLVLLFTAGLFAQTLPPTAIGGAPAVKKDGPASPQQGSNPARAGVHSAQGQEPAAYTLGADDTFTLRVPDCEELNEKTFRVDSNGYTNLPMIGSIQASGLTIPTFEAEITQRLKTYLRDPQVGITVAEFRSQPVSVLGAVASPGVHQVRGNLTLLEAISAAGGIRNDAGSVAKITRLQTYGRIPLPNATDDATGNYSVAEVNLNAVMDATDPSANIAIKPHDVISVSRAEMIYVTGDVAKIGGITLNHRETVSVMRAVTLAGGITRTAAAGSAKILRTKPGTNERIEIALDLKKILHNQAPDLDMQPEDILFVPGSTGKRAALRALEAVIGAGTSIAVFQGARP